MKKGVFLAVVALSVVASVATTYFMNGRYEKSLSGDVEKSAGESINNRELSNLPDLTAAAKLGVEAVVYIENITKGSSSRARVYKFFGIPFVVPEKPSFPFRRG